MDSISFEEELAARGQEEEVIGNFLTQDDVIDRKRKSDLPDAHNSVVVKKTKNALAESELAGQIVQAARTGDFEGMKQLVDQGANVNDTVCGCTGLMYASFYGRDEMARFLLAHGAKVDEKNLNGATALIWAVERQHCSMLRILLHSGANVNVVDSKGFSALHKAARSGNLDLVKALVEEGGANVSLESSKELDCCSVLQEAAFYGQQQIVQYLLEHGADVDQQNSQGRTALHRAVYKNHSAIVQLLLDCGCNIDAQDNSDRTALHWAAFFGHFESFKVLMENGADISITDKSKLTAEDIATNKRQNQILEHLHSQDAIVQ